MANPPAVNDTNSHAVSVDVNSIVPFIRYYYRLKGVSANENYYGNINSFVQGNAFSVLQTLQPTNQGGSTTFTGVIDNFLIPALLSFEYDTNMQFRNSVSAIPAFVSDTMEHAVSASVSGLQALTQYYCRLKAHTSIGDYYGGVMSFINGLNTDYETTAATNVTATSATLNGTIGKFRMPVTVSFDYGTNPNNFDHSIPASPDTINDTIPHQVSAAINGLQPGSQYFFRVKVHTAYGDFTGNTLTFNSFDPGKNKVKVYPNPCHGTLFVELQQSLGEESNVQLFNLNGKLCRQSLLPALHNKTSLNTLDLETGFYIVRISMGKEQFTAKVLLIN